MEIKKVLEESGVILGRKSGDFLQETKFIPIRLIIKKNAFIKLGDFVR